MEPITYLFVPATRPERVAKAFASGAHAVIADLEDAVDARDKSSARACIDKLLAEVAQPRPLWLRVNAVNTPWFAEDLALVHKHQHVLAGVVLSKTDSASDVQALGERVPVLALIESARGLLALSDICRHPRVARLAFGAADFATDLGCAEDADLLLPARMQLVTHSVAAGLPPPVDGVTFVLQDAVQAQSDAANAARMGFGAKLCIHPAQLDPVLRGFAPSDAQLQWAERVIAVADSGTGAQRADGQMVDRPVIERARRMLQRRDPYRG